MADLSKTTLAAKLLREALEKKENLLGFIPKKVPDYVKEDFKREVLDLGVIPKEVLNELEESRIEKSLEEPPLKVHVGSANGFVMILFDRPMSKLKLSKQDARAFATQLNKESLK